MYEGNKSLTECLKMDLAEVDMHLIMNNAHIERENERQRERMAEQGIEDPTAKPDYIPEDLWKRMGPQLRKQSRGRQYDVEQLRKQVDRT